MRFDSSNSLFLLLMLLITSCGSGGGSQKENDTPSDDISVLKGKAQGTYFQIKYSSTNDQGLSKAVDSVLHRIDASLSMYKDSSGVNDFNRSDSGTCVDRHFQKVFEYSRKVFETTQGAFDPTVLPLVEAWGFGPSGRPENQPDRLDSLLDIVGLDRLHAASKEKTRNDSNACSFLKKEDPRIQFDPNAIAQGYTVDVLATLLRDEFQVRNAMIELGGEVRTIGTKKSGQPWRIGIDKPVEPGQKRRMQAVVELDGKSLATSGSYRKFYTMDGKKYSHTIDPATGKPVQHHLLSVTVLYENCAEADAYATAFMVMGEKEAKKILRNIPDMEAYFISSGGDGTYRTYYTEGMKKVIQER